RNAAEILAQHAQQRSFGVAARLDRAAVQCELHHLLGGGSGRRLAFDNRHGSEGRFYEGDDIRTKAVLLKFRYNLLPRARGWGIRMAELVLVPFCDLVNRLYREVRTNDALFGLPRKKWYVPSPNGPDLTVRFHDKLAGNASGPAAGPQTQMAQNILL